MIEGVGTPAPVAPTQRLVVGGTYRYVRNPMYLAVTALMLSAYAAAFWAVVAAFVHEYEEPALARRFGAEYERYGDAVPAWTPRRTPWRG